MRRRTLVPRSRASAHHAFQTRCRWRASAVFRLRARRRLTDFCNTNRRTGTISSCRSTPATEAKTSAAPCAIARSFSFESARTSRTRREPRVSRSMGVTHQSHLAVSGDARAERLRAKVAGALGAGNPLLDSDSCTHCRDSTALAWTETHSCDRATKIRVCTASREGIRTPANQGAFHLRQVSFERSESLPHARPRLIPFYAGACPSRSRCHCKRGIRAFVTPTDAWA